MIGFPGETVEEVQATLDFAVSAPFDSIFVSIVAPFKGTKLRTDMMAGRFGEITDEGQAALNELFPVVHNQALPRDLLLKMQKDAYWRFYSKPRSVMNLARKLTNYRNAVKISRAISRRVFERTPASVN